MRHLVISLYFGVFIALLGLGWGIDQYYNRTIESTQQQHYPAYRAILNMAVQQLSPLVSNQSSMENYLQQQSLSFSLEPLEAIPLPGSLALQRDRGEIFILQSNTTDTLYKRIADSNWLLSVEIEVAIQQPQQITRYVLTLLFYAGVAAILLLWLLPLLRGVTQLNRAAKNIGEGNLNTRVKNPDSLYLKPLKTEFNAMAERLQQLNENNRLMSQAVSHELRTPLSRLRFALNLLQGRQDQQQREQDIFRMESDLDDMEGLINELLNYARLDQQLLLEREPVKIEALIKERIQRTIGTECNIELVNESTQSSIEADYDFLSKLVDNLIQNACWYAVARILICCHWTDSHFCLTVEDDGTGIASDQSENIFKPFLSGKESDS